MDFNHIYKVPSQKHLDQCLIEDWSLSTLTHIQD